MDKQKQIEEMSRIIYKDFQAPEKYIAEQLYNACYRKIPEGAVVFTEENMEQTANWLVTHPKMQETMWKLIKAWRKETAEKIMNDISGDVLVVDTKEYGRIEVVPLERFDEICKEITEGSNG